MFCALQQQACDAALERCIATMCCFPARNVPLHAQACTCDLASKRCEYRVIDRPGSGRAYALHPMFCIEYVVLRMQHVVLFIGNAETS